MLRLSRSICLSVVCLLTAISLWNADAAAQDILGKMALNDISQTDEIRGKVVRDPDQALLVVKSTIRELSFESNNLIYRVEENEPGIWFLFVRPGTHRIKFKARGYLAIQKRIFFLAKQSVGYEVNVELLGNKNAAKAFVVITSQPADAEIYIDENYLGNTNYQGRIPAGTYQVRLSRHLYEDVSRQVVLIANQTNNLDFQLSSSAGTIQVTSLPDSVELLLNGLPVGRTPYLSGPLPPGSYAIQLKSELYRDAFKTVALAEGENLKEEITLAPNYGTVMIDAPASIAIFIDSAGQDSLKTRFRLKPGYHIFEGRKGDVVVSRVERTVNVGDELPISLAPEEKIGRLVVYLKPFSVHGAEVLLDGVPLGTAPGQFDKIAAGKHLLTIQQDGYGPFEQPIEIQTDREVSVYAELLPSGSRIQPDADAYPTPGYQNGSSFRRWPVIAGGGIAAGVVVFLLARQGGDSGSPPVDEAGIPDPVFPGNP